MPAAATTCARADFTLDVPYELDCYLQMLDEFLTEQIPPGTPTHLVKFWYQGGIRGNDGEAEAQSFNIYMYNRSDKNPAGTPDSPLLTGLPTVANITPAKPKKGKPTDAQVASPSIDDASDSGDPAIGNVWVGSFTLNDWPNSGSDTEDITRNTTFYGAVELVP